MAPGRFIAGIGALIWSPADGCYLVLRRSPEKDFAAGQWECVTGRVDQGEGFEDALRREVHEEIGTEVEIDFVLGTTHFYRGRPDPGNELLGILYACSVADPTAVRISAEHSEHRWVTAGQATALLVDEEPGTPWLVRAIARAEAIRRLLPPELLLYFHRSGFEQG